MKSSIVLLSSGLDSTVNLWKAHQETKIKKVLTFNYGQKAAAKEIEHAKKQCEALNLDHQIIEISWLAGITKTSLVNKSEDVPIGDDVSIDDYETSMQTAARVWVPNRNGVFLNIAAAFADSLNADFVVPGFNLEEATTFPDNSTDYLKSLDNAFSYSTSNKVQVKCYTDHLNKPQIVALGKELGVNFDLVWSCYFDGETPCGQCESCQRLERALKENA